MVTAARQESIATSFTSLLPYDVLLISRGLYIEKSFLDCLHYRLVDNGFRTFRSDEDLPEMRGNIIGWVVNESRKASASIVLCSKDESSSPWFLNELELASERQSFPTRHVVLPVVYDVDRFGCISQSPCLRNEYMERFGLFQDRDSYLPKGSNFVQKIVEDVAEKLRPILFASLPNQFGVGGDIRLICGVGGIGKTTIAKHVYVSNYEKFESSSFVSDIDITLLQHRTDGIVRLQKQLLTDLLGAERGKEVSSVDVGISMIKDVLRKRRVLIVLDDVLHPYQLDMLGMQTSFHPGSRIMITSRNKNLLLGYESYKLHEVEPLNEDEAFELFNLRAFGRKINDAVSNDEEHLSKDVIKRCKGIPLVLSVVVSSLLRRDVREWHETVREFDHHVDHDDNDDSSTTLLKDDYDVFLSFGGDYKSKTFINRLYNALVKAGHRTFKDGQKMVTEETRRQIIRQSRCCIIVFFKHCVFNQWFLDELGMIVDSNSPHRILPVYYGVEISDVMHQFGSLRAPFFSVYQKEVDNKMKKKLGNDVERWKAAFKQILAHTPGFNFPNVSSIGNEQEIMEDLAEELRHTVLRGLPKQTGVGELEISSVDCSVIQTRLLKFGFYLLEEKEKALFLHIACFFVGEDKDYAVTILEGCGLYAEIGIRNLMKMCLLTVNEDNKLMMHRMIQDMGREIVRQESPLEPDKRSRLWRREDSLHVLRSGRMGTNAIEGLALELHAPEYESSWHCGLLDTVIYSFSSSPSSLATKTSIETSSFSNMKNLRILKLRNVGLTGGYERFPKNLRCLSLHGLSTPAAADFPMENLVALDLKHCTFKQAWSGTKSLPLLKWLDLSHCYALQITPDLSGLIKLETLILEECSNLVEIHESVGELERLSLLNIKGCTKLVKLTTRVARKLNSVEHLLLSGCSKELCTLFRVLL